MIKNLTILADFKKKILKSIKYKEENQTKYYHMRFRDDEIKDLLRVLEEMGKKDN